VVCNVDKKTLQRKTYARKVSWIVERGWTSELRELEDFKLNWSCDKHVKKLLRFVPY
jgi:hypothetical protein